MDGRRTARALFAVLALALIPAPAAAQEGVEGLEEPAMADAPDQFRVSATGGWLAWEDPGADAGVAEEQRVEGAALWGVELETRVGRYLAFRLGGAYGRTSITSVGPGGDPRSVDVNQVVLELVAEPRLEVGPLRRAGVVPFGLAGLGSVIHDPSTETGEFDPPLTTRSQGSLIWGGGVDVSPPVLGGAGLRLEWRRAEVQMQPIFTPTTLEGTPRGAGRFMGSFYLTL